MRINNIARKIREGQTAASCANCGCSVGVRRPDGTTMFKSANRKVLVAGNTVQVKCGECGEFTPIPLSVG